MSDRTRARSLPDVLYRRAREEPDWLAFRFLADGTTSSAVDWSYRELARHAATVAARIEAAAPGARRVVLALEPGLLYVAGLFGIMQAGATGVPAFPPAGRRAAERFATTVADARPELVIAGPRMQSRVADVERALPAGVPAPRWLFLDAGDVVEQDTPLPDAPPQPRDPALLQYTSGSTGTPKGIVLDHRHLVANCVALEASIGHEPDRIGCSWLPPYHDMGLMGTILHAVHGGWPLVMFSPAHFVQRPVRWLQALSEYRVTITVGPNFAFDLCTTAIDDDEADGLDLSALRHVFCGSEPVSRPTLDRFRERFAPAGYDESTLIPCYGLAEATLYVSGKRPHTPVRTLALDADALSRGVVSGDAGDAPTAVVSCGDVAAEHEVLVVDPDTLRPAPPDRVGEIWVRGPIVAGGYLGRPELTEATFAARTADGDDRTWLRTGDLGFLDDGELFVTGRIKDVVVIAGRNLYPQDVERTAREAHDTVRGVAAFGVPGPDGAEALVVAAEFRGTARRLAADHPALRDELIAAVTAEHGVRPLDVHIAPAGAIPTTTSGKVRRSATRDAYRAGRLPSLLQTDADPVVVR